MIGPLAGHVDHGLQLTVFVEAQTDLHTNQTNYVSDSKIWDLNRPIAAPREPWTRSHCNIYHPTTKLITTTQQPKTVLITGATRGLGLQFAKHYASSGWNVIAAARNPDSALKLKDLSPWKIVQLDTSDEQSILRAATELKSVPIDLLINNAGIFEGGDINVTTKADLMRQFEVNVTGPFLTTRALLPNLKLATKGAFVVQLSSFLGSIQLNSEGNLMAGGIYGCRAAKAALNMITKSLAVDLKSDNVSFLPINPGYVATDMTNHAEGGISVETSVAGMTKVIASFTLADSGMFLDYQGNDLPW